MNSKDSNTTVAKTPCCHIGCNKEATHVINPDVFEHNSFSCEKHIEDLKEDGLPNNVIPIEEYADMLPRNKEPEEDTEINLCNTCRIYFPDCGATDEDITFGDDNNICKCKKYEGHQQF